MEDRKFRIDSSNLASLLPEDGAGIELSAKKDGQVFGGVLVHAAVEVRDCRVRQLFRAGICNHADDRGPGRLGRVQRRAGIHVETDTFCQADPGLASRREPRLH